MTTSNRGKTNANQQIVNVHLNGLDLEKMVAKPKEKSKRRGGLAAELRRAAKRHQTAKDNAEKRGVQVPQNLATPPDHLLDATTTPQIQALSNHLANSATAIRQLSQEPYKRVGDFGPAITRKRPMTPEELAAASAKAAEDRAAAAAKAAEDRAAASAKAAEDRVAVATNAGQTDTQKVEAAIEDANKWLADSTSVVVDGGADVAQATAALVRFISRGSVVSTNLIMARDEAYRLDRLQDVEEIHERVFLQSANLGKQLASVEENAETSRFLIEAIENIGKNFASLQLEHDAQTVSAAETQEIVIMLLGELNQIKTFITSLGGDGKLDTIVELEQKMKDYKEKLVPAIQQSAVIARATKKKTEMQALLGVWETYEKKTPEIQGTTELENVYKSLENFIAKLGELELAQNPTVQDLDDVVGVQRIVNDVAKFHNNYNRPYFDTVLGLFSYYRDDQGYRTKGPRSGNNLSLRPVMSDAFGFDRHYVVFSGDTKLGGREEVLTKFGTKPKKGNNTTTGVCTLGFIGGGGSRRGLDMCVLLPGVDSPPPNKPSDSDPVSTWVEYKTTLIAWSQKNWGFMPIAQRQALQALRDYASSRVEAGGSQPTSGSGLDGVVGEEWPVWHDGRSFPRYPGDNATAQVWQTFISRTFVYMTDKDSELTDDQMDQLNARIDRANAMLERLLPATPTVPETGGGRGHGSGNDLGPADPDQWTEPGAVVCPEWDGISFPVAPRNMSTASKNQIVCYINNLRTYRGHAGITQIELDIVDDLLEEALIARARAP